MLIGAVFIAVSLFSNDNLFFMFYPCLLCGMIPVNLLGYDERSRWMQYSGILPYTKTQIVSAKYLIGLLAQVTVLLVTSLAQGIKMAVGGNFIFGEFAVLMLLISDFILEGKRRHFKCVDKIKNAQRMLKSPGPQHQYVMSLI